MTEWWNPDDFNPFDSMVQLSKNQEAMYHKITALNRSAVELQAQLAIQERHTKQLEAMVEELLFEVIQLKKK